MFFFFIFSVYIGPLFLITSIKFSLQALLIKIYPKIPHLGNSNLVLPSHCLPFQTLFYYLSLFLSPLQKEGYEGSRVNPWRLSERECNIYFAGKLQYPIPVVYYLLGQFCKKENDSILESLSLSILASNKYYLLSFYYFLIFKKVKCLKHNSCIFTHFMFVNRIFLLHNFQFWMAILLVVLHIL